jgi:uncharacterized protein YbjT (DUF2867 family)
MTVRVLVTGGSGTLGRAVLRRLLDGGGPDGAGGVRALSRRPRSAIGGETWVAGDLTTGEGIADAVRDVDVVVHCATNARRPADDIAGTGRLIEALEAAGSPHLIYVSIVGIDRVPLPYYKTKLAVEGLVERSSVPWTILRATQFHDLARTFVSALARLPVMLLPAGMSLQPVDVTDVADRLADLVAAPATGRATDLGGPQVRTLKDLARAYLAAEGKRRPILGVRLPGAILRAYREGYHLTPEHADGRITFEEFLRKRASGR